MASMAPSLAMSSYDQTNCTEYPSIQKLETPGERYRNTVRGRLNGAGPGGLQGLIVCCIKFRFYRIFPVCPPHTLWIVRSSRLRKPRRQPFSSEVIGSAL